MGSDAPAARTAISVVMGVFNGAAYLRETIDSVLCQTCEDFEFIIVDDGSTDPRVGSILAECAARDSRIRVIHQSNEGLTRALIAGCAAARGEYIARIDAGDTMTPDRLRRQKAVLDAHPDVVLVTCWTEFCGPEWEHLHTTRGKTIGAAGAEFWMADVLPARAGENLLDGPTSHPSTMFRTTAYRSVGGYRWQFYYSQDWDLWYRLVERGKFAGVQDTLYRCRIFPDGISMRNTQRQRRIYNYCFAAFLARRRGESEDYVLEAAAAVRPRTDGSPRQAHATRSSAAGHYYIGEALRRNGDRRCGAYFKNALRLDMFHIPSWIRLIQSRRTAGAKP